MVYALLMGLLITLIGLMGALAIGNIVILILLHDLPWFRLFRAQHDVETLKNVVYLEGSHHRKNRLDIYIPKGEKKFPVAVFVHGGYWVSGDKELYLPVTGLYANVGVALARRGICAVVPSYRLVPEVTFEEQAADVAAAFKWVRANIGHFGGDSSAVFLMGHSAGGQIAALIASEPERYGIAPDDIKGLIALSAVYDLEDMAAKNDAAFNATVTNRVFGKGERLKLHSPLLKFRSGMPPALIMNGQHDFPYLLSQGERAAKRLAETGNECVSATAPRYKHMDMVLKFGLGRDPVAERTRTFIKDRWKK